MMSMPPRSRWLAYRRTIRAGVACAETSALRDRNLQREVVDHLVTFVGHDEGVAEENPEQPIRRDRIRLGHDHHAGLEDLLELLRRDMLGHDMRAVGDKI